MRLVPGLGGGPRRQADVQVAQLALVDGIGHRRVSLIGLPDVPPPDRLEELGVARVSYGPATQRVSLGPLQDLAAMLYSGGVLPDGIRPLN